MMITASPRWLLSVIALSFLVFSVTSFLPLCLLPFGNFSAGPRFYLDLPSLAHFCLSFSYCLTLFLLYPMKGFLSFLLPSIYEGCSQSRLETWKQKEAEAALPCQPEGRADSFSIAQSSLCLLWTSGVLENGFCPPKRLLAIGWRMPKLCLWLHLVLWPQCELSKEIWWHWSVWGTEPNHGPTQLSASAFSAEKSHLIPTPVHGWIITGNPDPLSWKERLLKEEFQAFLLFPFSCSLALCLYSAFFSSPCKSRLTPPCTVLCLDEQETPKM